MDGQQLDRREGFRQALIVAFSLNVFRSDGFKCHAVELLSDLLIQDVLRTAFKFDLVAFLSYYICAERNYFSHCELTMHVIGILFEMMKREI